MHTWSAAQIIHFQTGVVGHDKDTSVQPTQCSELRTVYQPSVKLLRLSCSILGKCFPALLQIRDTVESSHANTTKGGAENSSDLPNLVLVPGGKDQMDHDPVFKVGARLSRGLSR